MSFQIDTDWKLGFCGRNGRGKTTFLRLLTGEYEYSGSITASVIFEYFPYSVTDMRQCTLDVIGAISPKAQLWQIQRELGKLAVTEDVLQRPYSTLSNGERTKLLLAGMFLRWRWGYCYELFSIFLENSIYIQQKLVYSWHINVLHLLKPCVPT